MFLAVGTKLWWKILVKSSDIRFIRHISTINYLKLIILITYWAIDQTTVCNLCDIISSRKKIYFSAIKTLLTLKPSYKDRKPNANVFDIKKNHKTKVLQKLMLILPNDLLLTACYTLGAIVCIAFLVFTLFVSEILKYPAESDKEL